ncbi:unnamed protein product, partial [Mesorhabditis spiculigera]
MMDRKEEEGPVAGLKGIDNTAANVKENTSFRAQETRGQTRNTTAKDAPWFLTNYLQFPLTGQLNALLGTGRPRERL